MIPKGHIKVFGTESKIGKKLNHRRFEINIIKLIQ
jgi:hypothetical protein